MYYAVSFRVKIYKNSFVVVEDSINIHNHFSSSSYRYERAKLSGEIDFISIPVYHSSTCLFRDTISHIRRPLREVDRGKYLGITINQDLQWTCHIYNTIGNATRSLGFLRRNLGRCKPTVKSTAYCTLIRPSIEYASSVWDPHQTTVIRDLEQVQHRAARFVFNQYTNTSPGCVTNLLDRLEWDSLQHRRTKHRLVLCYKVRNHLVDIDPAKYFTPGDSRTRGGHRYRQPRTNKDTYRHSFFPRSVRDWNRLPETATAASSLEEFRAILDSVPWTQLEPW